MYSQYNQYQQPGMTVTTGQSGLTWNGTAWVPTTATINPASVSSNTHSTYASTTPSNQPAADLVQKYTQYYHLWKAQEQEQERHAQSLPDGNPAKAQAQQQAQWAKFYADQASIAAHHYHNTPHAAPPALPPVPPSAGTGAAAAQPQQQPVATQPQQQLASTQQHPQESPDGLKRFVHKCLQQYSGNPEQQKRIQSQVESVIAQAIRNGTMHTMDWDAQPLLKLQEDTATIVQQSGGTAAAIKKFRQQQVSSQHYYGPSVSSGNQYGPTPTVQPQEHQKPSLRAAPPTSSGSSYYGPSPTSNHYGQSSTNEDDKHKSKWTLQDKFPAADDFVSLDNYYGKSSGPKSNSDLGDEDFVSLSSGKKKRKRKKSEKSPTTLKVNKQVILQSSKNGFERSTLALAKRANRFAETSSSASIGGSKENMDRFMGLALIGGSKKLEESDYEHMKVKGTCTTLEKDYLRLTAPPRPELVRPEPILRQHLKNLKTEWTAPKHRDYLWFCSQLKAVRQDLTVQQIANAFAVDVYETHARIALEQDDLNEYNQCQTQLKELYKMLHDDEEATKNQDEFIAYRLIYYVFLQGNQKYKGGSSDLFNIMLSLTPEQRQDSFISHALQVRVAVAEYDYHAFFRLLKDCSEHGRFLMNYMIPKVRHSALQRICKAYRPSVSTKYVLQELGFDVDKEFDFGKRWLATCGVVLSESGDVLLAKDSVVRESDLHEKASSLI